MAAIQHALLVAGLIFPTISLFTAITSGLTYWIRGKRSSAIFIPFIGPLLIDASLLLGHEPIWILLLPWVLDIGTVAFLFATPRMLREWWSTSSFTRERLLVGESGNQSVTLSLHTTHAYLLRKKWQRQPGELGIVSFGEPGKFQRIDAQINLRAYNGRIRELKPMGDNTYLVEEPQSLAEDYSLSGWVLREVPATP